VCLPETCESLARYSLVVLAQGQSKTILTPEKLIRLKLSDFNTQGGSILHGDASDLSSSF
jgi:hypothetical protein